MAFMINMVLVIEIIHENQGILPTGTKPLLNVEDKLHSETCSSSTKSTDWLPNNRIE